MSCGRSACKVGRMFGKRYRLFSLFGFDVSIDLSWLIIAALIVWSLTSGFPQFYAGYPWYVYLTMGITGALGFFLSIVFHEFSHSFVARAFDLKINGITLFIFGGLAEMEERGPLSPRAEFWMALAGPLSSVVLGVTFLGLEAAGRAFAWPVPVIGVLGYLRLINFILAIFNLVPAFPLDGGRILRSILWGWKKDIRWATHIAAEFGNGFGWFLIFMGMFSMFRGQIVVGFWYFLIGMFMRSLAMMSYREIGYGHT